MDIMLSKYISPGGKIQLQKIRRLKEENEEQKLYDSQIIDIISDERIEALMPFVKSNPILLPVDGEYNVFFHTGTGSYQCSARVADIYKNNNVFSALLELTSNLRKYQGREYYRFSCALEMNSRILDETEIQAARNNDKFIVPELPLQRGTIVDISGGGLRFVSPYAYEVDSMILCKYDLWISGESKKFSLIGKVLSVKEVENRPGVYEHRVQYVNMDRDNREEIVKYIFDAERKSIPKQGNAE